MDVADNTCVGDDEFPILRYWVELDGTPMHIKIPPTLSLVIRTAAFT